LTHILQKEFVLCLEKMNTNLGARTSTRSYDHTYANRYFYKHDWKLYRRILRLNISPHACYCYHFVTPKLLHYFKIVKLVYLCKLGVHSNVRNNNSYEIKINHKVSYMLMHSCLCILFIVLTGFYPNAKRFKNHLKIELENQFGKRKENFHLFHSPSLTFGLLARFPPWPARSLALLAGPAQFGRATVVTPSLLPSATDRPGPAASVASFLSPLSHRSLSLGRGRNRPAPMLRVMGAPSPASRPL
jgi:hypothetical protein